MAAIGILGSVAGLIQLSSVIITQLDDIRGASDEVQHVSDNVQSLADVLELVKDICGKHEPEMEAESLTRTLRAYTESCEKTLKSMRQVLVIIASRGVKSPMGRLIWARKKGALRVLHGRLTEGKATLTMLLTALYGVLGRKDQAETRADMAIVYRGSKDQLGRQGPSIRQKIEQDIESDSVSIQTARSLTTDVQFAMARFLSDTAELEDNDDSDTVMVDDQTFAPLITPASLLDAVRSRDYGRVVAILLREQNFSSRTPEGFSTLHYCAIYDDAAMAKLLLGHGADVDATDNQMRTPFKLAIACDAFSVAVEFLRHDCQIGNAAEVLHHVESRVKDGTISQEYLMSLRPCLSWKNQGKMIQFAILAENVQIVESFSPYFFEKAGREYAGLPLLFFALMHGKMKMMRLLVECGADVNEPASTTIFKAFDSSAPHMNAVVAIGGDVLPLEVATRVLNSLEMTRLLLDLGADPNVRRRTSTGESILSFLCAQSYLAVAEEMIRRGASLTLPGTEGKSVIFWATFCGNHELVKLLVANGGDVELRNKDGAGSPLINAVYNHNDTIVRILLDAGADIEARCMIGKTPLILAVEMSSLVVIKLLLRAGADIEAKGRQGQTPTSAAMARDDEDVIGLLVRARDDRL